MACTRVWSRPFWGRKQKLLQNQIRRGVWSGEAQAQTLHRHLGTSAHQLLLWSFAGSHCHLLLTLKASSDLHAQLSRTSGSLSKQMTPKGWKEASPVPECPVMDTSRSVTYVPWGKIRLNPWTCFSKWTPLSLSWALMPVPARVIVCRRVFFQETDLWSVSRN